MPINDYLPSTNIAEDSFPEPASFGLGELPQICVQSVDVGVQKPDKESMLIF